MCISVSKVPKTLENKGFFLDTDKNFMCIYVYHLYQMCISSGTAFIMPFVTFFTSVTNVTNVITHNICGSRINLYTVNIQYTDRPLKAFIYKEKYGKMSIEK